MSRPPKPYSQAVRLLKIVEMLISNRHVTLPRIMEECAVSRRTAQRDLNSLQETYSICETGTSDEGYKQWSLVGSARGDFIKLSVLEMTALYIGRNLFNFTEGTDIKSAIDSLFMKISHRLAFRDDRFKERLPRKFYVTPGAPKPYAECDDQLNAIITALLNEHRLRVDYRSVKRAQPASDVLWPLSLVVHQRALYLLAHSERNRSIRTYAVERIVRAVWLKEQPFDYPVDFSPEAFLKSAFGIQVGSPQPVVLAVDSDTLLFFKERIWHWSQEIQVLPEGSGRVRLFAPDTPEFLAWLLSFGPKIEVLSPDSLRRKVSETLHRSAQIYSKGTTPRREA